MPTATRKRFVRFRTKFQDTSKQKRIQFWKRSHKVRRIQQCDPIRCYPLVPAYDDTVRIDLTGLVFSPKSGFEILKKKGIFVYYTIADKIRAAMYHKVLLKVPGYNPPTFDDAEAATAYVLCELKRLFPTAYHSLQTLDGKDINNQTTKIPEDYMLAVITEEQELGMNGSWLNYGNILLFKDDPEVFKCLLMAFHLITSFGFTYADNDESYAEFMSYEQQYEWLLETSTERLHYDEEELKENKAKRKKTKKTEREQIDQTIESLEEEIKGQQEYINKLMDEKEHFEENALPLIKRIKNIRPNYSFMYRVAERMKQDCDADFYYWIDHIIKLAKYKFRVEDYLLGFSNEVSGSDSRYSNHDESSSPLVFFALMFDNKSEIISSVDETTTERCNNCGILPFVNYMVYHPVHGLIKELKEAPVEFWVRKIFYFNTKTLSYESDIHFKTESVISPILKKRVKRSELSQQ